MKYLKIFFVTIFFNFLMSGNAIADEASNHTNQQTVYLYIEMADAGVLEKNDNDSYKLTLQDVNPWISYFTLTPKRHTGLLHVNDFNKVLIKEIQRSTKQSPKGLNTGLVARDLSDQKNISYTVSLKNPVYNAKDKSVTYVAHLLPGLQANSIPKKLIFNRVTLFIDACPGCGGQGL